MDKIGDIGKGVVKVRANNATKECLTVNRKAYLSLVDQRGVVPTRLGLPYPNNPTDSQTKRTTEATLATTTEAQDWTLIKPAAYYDDAHAESNNSTVIMGLKVVSIRAENPSRGLPLVPATILLVNSMTGIVEATLGGTYLTTARTSAGPALAVQTFQPNCQELVIFGAGSQAECHIQLMELALGRSIPKITIINRSQERAEALRAKISSRTKTDVIVLHDQQAVIQALSTADVVSATTNSPTPLWEDGSVLKKGCLITGIGSYTPDMQEIPPSAVDRSFVIIDTPEAMEVGDLKHLRETPSETRHHPITLMGSALANPASIIERGMDCIFYKAVGTAIQDVLTAEIVVNKARALGIGQEIDMS